ncbi:HEPN-associated N-terminal domain-containing protein [Couchioplanes azureus]|uniref:HEPN-associated N-terminal domain-containing protein n=1 Tax=Couchioplanes caeruleus TaxID=56438 RepID=UPI001670CA3B|nr:HEPN-associated N-terminal domain-containing protein [Couchioplanes caeruleus]GGQ70226.1 hypothetical protein GCM10010166_45110 [Couchioplanes caeruleus subsp. azureus]
MGVAKAKMMEEEEQGWSYTDKFVCTACVDDYALEGAIRADETAGDVCDFCDRSPAAPLDSMLETFVDGLRNEYEDAAEGVSYDSSEDGWQWWGPIWNTYDLVSDHSDVLIGDGLVEAVQTAMHDRTWVEKDFAWRRRDQVLNESWDQFCNAVKYRTRYVIWLQDDPDELEADHTGEVPPARILDEIGRLIERLNLIQPLPAGSRLWRAQTHSDPTIDHTAARLGTSPVKYAKQANRMNPAGIPMFYGAADSKTAIREVAFRTDDSHVTLGLFETSIDSVVVDFTCLRPVPSMFDPEWGGFRRQLLFLHRFVNQLSDRVRPEYEQIDYVPTQILTEYLLRVYEKGRLVHGLLYTSSITGGTSAVLDVPNDRCVEQAADWRANDALRLGIDPSSIKSRKLTADDKTV